MWSCTTSYKQQGPTSKLQLNSTLCVGENTEIMFLQLVVVLVGVLTFLFFRIWKKLKLWSSMGLVEDPGSFVMGSQPNSDALSQKSSFNDMFDEAYEKFQDQNMWGSYGMFGEPHLIINDLDLAKDVLIKA